MKKKLLTIAIALLTLLSIGGGVLAEEGVSNNSQTLNGTDQQQNVIKINSFNMDGTVANVKFSVNKNLTEGHVKYSVALEKIIDKDENITSGFMVDKVYIPEKDILFVNSGREYSFSHDFGYLVPANYRVVVRMENLAGNPIALVSSDDVKVNTNNKNELIIDNFSCQIHISEDEYDRTYGLYDGPDVTTGEHLVMFCDVINNPHIRGNLKVKYSIFDRKGQEVENGLENEDVVLQGSDKERVAVEIPIAKKPQAYDAKISLQTAGGQETNKVKVHYVVQGVSGTIQNVSIDNLESINKDKQIKLTVQLSGRADYFIGSRTLEKNSKIQQTQSSLKIKAINIAGKVCGKIDKNIALGADIKNINLGLTVDAECQPTKIKVILLDTKNNKLDEVVLPIAQTMTDEVLQKNENNINESRTYLSSKVMAFVFGGILAIILIGFLIFIAFKKKGLNIFIFLVGISLLCVGASTAHASPVTLMVPPPSVWGGLGNMPLVITPDVSSCKNAKLDFDVTVKSCSNSMQSRMEISYKGESGGKSLIKTAYSKCNSEKKLHKINNKIACVLKGNNYTWKGGACWKTTTRSEKEKSCVDPNQINNTTSFSYTSVPKSVGSHSVIIYARYFPDPHSGNNSNQGEEVHTGVSYTVSKCATCTGFLSPGATICPGTTTGLTKDTGWELIDNCENAGDAKCKYEFQCSDGDPTKQPPFKATWCPGDDHGLTSRTNWHEVSTCTTTDKCEYYFKPECGPANKHSFSTETQVEQAGLCETNNTASSIDSSGLEVGDPWTWTCSRSGQTIDCKAYQIGQCNSNHNSLSLNSACTAGKINSIYFDGTTLTWACGTLTNGQPANPPLTLLYNNTTITGYNFTHLTVTDSTEKHSSGADCSCTPQYQYSCVSQGYDCNNKCGQNVTEVYQAYKKDIHCFPGNSQPIPIAQQEYNNHNSTTCTNKSVTCPPCGVGGGGSDTVNETN